jgi:hypothetical protein
MKACIAAIFRKVALTLHKRQILFMWGMRD